MALVSNVMNLNLRDARHAFERAYLLRLMQRFNGRVFLVALHAGYSGVPGCRNRLRELGLFPWVTIEDASAPMLAAPVPIASIAEPPEPLVARERDGELIMEAP